VDRLGLHHRGVGRSRCLLDLRSEEKMKRLIYRLTPYATILAMAWAMGAPKRWG